MPDVLGVIFQVRTTYPLAFGVNCVRCGRLRHVHKNNSVDTTRVLYSSGWREMSDGWVCKKCLAVKIIGVPKPEVPGYAI